jgi:hypothetical protein
MFADIHSLKYRSITDRAVQQDFFYLICEAIGTAATPGLLCQPRVIVKMIVGEADGM